ncbi:ribonuclease P protein component [Crocinitomix algicola]|uniref:ribonuclease P protein component n=1 Tax=Crocinitomix algicola TaxID=1740263 RepID=UPI00082E7ABF|nr:ribonuclease P protein component [Crocinitomix algicola]
MKHTLKKSERLKSRLAIGEVYTKGKTLKKYPILAKFTPYIFNDNEVLKMGVAVPKKRIRKAVHRNRIRRQIKEAYRLNKWMLKEELTANKTSLALFFIYTGKENVDYSEIEAKIKVILKDLRKQITNDKEN